MKKLLLFIAILTLWSIGHKAEAFTFTFARNTCEKYYDIPRSTFPNGPYTYIIESQPGMTWPAVVGAASYKIYKTPQGLPETLVLNPVIGNISTYGRVSGKLLGFYSEDPTRGQYYEPIVSTLQNAVYRIEAYNSSDVLIDTGTTASFGADCQATGASMPPGGGPYTLNGIDKSATGPGIVSSDISYSYSGSTRRRFDLTIDSIKNSSGVDMIANGIPAANVSLTPTFVDDNGDVSTVSVNLPATLPNGVYTVKVKGTSKGIGGFCSSSITDAEAWEVEGPKNYKGEITCDGDGGDHFEWLGLTEYGSGITLLKSYMDNFKKSYCGNNNYTPIASAGQRAGNFFCNATPVIKYTIYTTFAITYNPTVEPNPFDFDLQTVSNSKVSLGNTVTNQVNVKLNSGTAQPVGVSVNRILDDANRSVMSIDPENPTINSVTSPVTPTAPSDIVFGTASTTAPGIYTIFTNGGSNLTLTTPISSLDVDCKGVHTTSGRGYLGSTGTNLLECTTSDGLRLVSILLNRGFGVSNWNSVSYTDARNRFNSYADFYCGAGNWTSPSLPISFNVVNTVETFTCTLATPLDSIRLSRGTAYQVYVDPYQMTLTDGPFTDCRGSVTSNIQIAWVPVAGAISYNIYRDGTLITNVPAGTTYWHDQVPVPGNLYSYTMNADIGSMVLPMSDKKSRVSYKPPERDCPSGGTVDLMVRCDYMGEEGVGGRPRWHAVVAGNTGTVRYDWSGTVPRISSETNTSSNFTARDVLIADIDPGPNISVYDSTSRRSSLEVGCPRASFKGIKLQLLLSGGGKERVGGTTIAVPLKVKKGSINTLVIVESNGVGNCIKESGLELRNDFGTRGVWGPTNDNGIGNLASIPYPGYQLNTNGLGKRELKITCEDNAKPGVFYSSSGVYEVFPDASLEEF